MAMQCFKTRSGKMTKISNRICKSKKSINNLLGEGFVVSKITLHGNKTKIKTFSPRTYEEYRKSGGT